MKTKTIKEHEGSKYLRLINSPLENEHSIHIDVYEVLVAFNITCPARQHCIKKLLTAGNRQGHRNEVEDLISAEAALSRAIDLQKVRERKTFIKEAVEVYKNIFVDTDDLKNEDVVQIEDLEKESFAKVVDNPKMEFTWREPLKKKNPLSTLKENDKGDIKSHYYSLLAKADKLKKVILATKFSISSLDLDDYEQTLINIGECLEKMKISERIEIDKKGES